MTLLTRSLALLFCLTPTAFSRVLISRQNSSTSDPFDITETLGSELSGDAAIFFPGSAEFRSSGSRWTQGVVNPQYFSSVEVASESDVESAITFANQNNISFLATTGGHGFWKGLNKVQNGLQIYTRRMNSIELDPETGIATMGGGVLAHEAQEFLNANGRYAATGLCPCVSVMGPGLGGGHGILQGRFGLVADNIVSARVTLGNGTSISVSATEHPDLYWGIKGAGQNFGIVTSFQYRTFPEPKNTTYTITTFYFTGDKLEELFTLVNDFNTRPNRPVELLIWGTIRRDTTLDAAPVVEVLVKWDGPENQAAPHSAPFAALDPLTTSTETFTNYIDLGPALGFSLDGVACDHSYDNGFMSISLVRYNLTTLREAYNVFWDVTNDVNFQRSYILLESYPINEVRRVPINSTAVSAEERRANNLVGGNFIYTRGNDTQAAIADASQKKLKTIFKAGADVTRDGQPGTYVNYANGEQSAQELYGFDAWRVERLNALSAKYDPHHRFGFFAGFRADNTNFSR